MAGRAPAAAWKTPVANVNAPTGHSVLIFIITILLLAGDFYYLKNIAGRRLVGLRWWNEVDPSSGDSKWVFESSEPGTKVVNPTDSRFFWLANYVQPLLWVALAILALVRFMFIWLPLVGESCTRGPARGAYFSDRVRKIQACGG